MIPNLPQMLPSISTSMILSVLQYIVSIYSLTDFDFEILG